MLHCNISIRKDLCRLGIWRLRGRHSSALSLREAPRLTTLKRVVYARQRDLK